MDKPNMKPSKPEFPPVSPNFIRALERAFPDPRDNWGPTTPLRSMDFTNGQQDVIRFLRQQLARQENDRVLLQHSQA